MTVGRCAQPSLTPMHRGQLPACFCRQPPMLDGLHRPSGRTASRNTPSTIMSPTRQQPASRTEIRLGVRAHPTRITHHAHAPPPLDEPHPAQIRRIERFIRTLIEGWAYGAIYGSTRERDVALDGWRWHYNHRRRHSAIGCKPPIARLTELNNPPGPYT